MKQFLPLALALACAALVISLVVMKRGDDAQHETDAGAITDFSNRLDSAQTQTSIYHGTILIYSNSLAEVSNRLDECQSAALTFSNHLTEAESTIARGAEQITSLNRQVAEAKSENQTLGRRVTDLTSQITGLTGQIAATQASLDQANKDYVLLENRFRIDVAERLVLQRKFYNLLELQTQMETLKENPGETVTAESIYAGLDVEVKSNGTFHVISPN